MNQQTEPSTPLDPIKIPKFINRLVRPAVFQPVKDETHNEKRVPRYVVDLSRFAQQILPEGLPMTTVWGYGGLVEDPQTGRLIYRRSSPGPTFEVRRGEKIRVKWVNRILMPHMFAVDPTIHWANPNGMPAVPPKPWPEYPPGFPEAQQPVPVVTHLHGGENPPVYDGFPEAWFAGSDKYGPAYRTDEYIYANAQQAATLWYHDHALGITRLNVCAGLAGFYIVRDPKSPAESCTALPTGKYELPIVIQDRSFYTNGSFAYPNVGDNPDIHPYWMPEFFGNVITVNGKAWPNLDVERKLYRFRLLNGSNARFYDFAFSNGMTFYQIGTDGGYLERPVELSSLLLAPAERADILVDFTSLQPEETIILNNSANAPYPGGDPADPDTVGQIMRFKVMCGEAERPSIPYILNKIPHLKPDTPERVLTLIEAGGMDGPTGVLLNGQMWDAPVTETPQVGSTGDWVIVNLTNDAHPIHLHLVQFKPVSRQYFDVDAYAAKWKELNGDALPLEHPTVTLSPDCFVTSPAMPPEANERGWKDTVKAFPGQITTLRVRFAPQDAPVCETKPGVNLYGFNPCAEPGYVWHCHILDHEDNEMMRPLKVT